MTPSTDHAITLAKLYLKFASMTEPQKVLARHVVRCLSCDAESTCAARQQFRNNPRTLPDCPLNASTVGTLEEAA